MTNDTSHAIRALASQPATTRQTDEVAPPVARHSPLPERDQSKPAEQQGMFRKFDVRRTDGSDQPGGKHDGCRYFVLDLTHDQHAPAAMRAYADSCADTHAQLAADIRAEFGAPVAQAPVVQDGLTEDEEIAVLVAVENYMRVVDFEGSQTATEAVKAEKVMYGEIAKIINARRPAPVAAPTQVAPVLTDEWMLVMDEVARATRKFPTWPTDPLHAIAVLGEEFGELTKAVLQTTYEPHKVQDGELRTEAVQTAAMALRFLASLDRYEFARCAQHAQGLAAAIQQDQQAGKDGA